MARPSNNVDQQLILAAQTLLPTTGIGSLSIRAVCAHAGVNLGMFHYHFKTKDAFVRIVLEAKYNEMFAALEMRSKGSAKAITNLRNSLNVLARFGRDNRTLLVRLIADALAGQAVAVEFLQANMPRHIAVIVALIDQAQERGELKVLPIPQVLAFIVGSVIAPILGGTVALERKFLPPAIGKAIEQTVFTDAAIAERVDMALLGLSAQKRKGTHS
jgi:AcrR family transcriptional regulator